MGFIYRLLFGESALTKQEKITIIKCLSCVVWADSNFEGSEGIVIQDIIKEIHGIPDKEILSILSSVKELDPLLEGEIRALPKVQAHTILKYIYRIANADDHINDKELSVIKKISELILPEKDWTLIIQWIEANNALVKTTRNLFPA